jgi:hypothetical protein
VREPIAVIQPIDPNLTIDQPFGRKSVLPHRSRPNRGNREATRFEKVLYGPPGQCEGVFEPLDHPLFFQRRQDSRTTPQRPPPQPKGAVEVLETLFPAHVLIRPHPPNVHTPTCLAHSNLTFWFIVDESPFLAEGARLRSWQKGRVSLVGTLRNDVSTHGTAAFAGN